LRASLPGLCKTMDMVGIKTTRYSAVIKAFLDRYPEATVRINRKIESRPVDQWCTNRNLCSIHNFSLSIGTETLLQFHDHPRDLLAKSDQRPLLEELASKGLLRIENPKVRKKKPSLFHRLFRGEA